MHARRERRHQHKTPSCLHGGERGRQLAILLHLLVLVPPTSGMASDDAIDRLQAATKIVRAMDEATLLALVPEQSGLQYVGCPNCSGGRQERQLTWSIQRPDAVVCRFCGHQYPSDTYPMNDAVVVRTPTGETARFEFWADASGYRFFFKARRDDEVRKYLARQTLNLARLYAATGESAHARRAAILLDRFAEVFPGWCFHYDYPFRQKVIYDGPVAAEDYRPGFRTARWNWWAYHDIPLDLLEAYHLLRHSAAIESLSAERGTDVARRIEYDLLRNAGEQVFANRDNGTNMSPSVWRSLVRLGRVVGEPRYVHEVVRRLRRLADQKFLYDGFWYEGAPSYARQTLISLDRVLAELEGYSDPPGYVDPRDGIRFDQLDLAAEFPVLARSRAAVEKMRLPSGRFVPVHDTWAHREPSERPPGIARGSFLLPALGHACLAGGAAPRPSELHLTWSGGYGHQHADVLSLLLFARERELLSDLGYSHTAYRAWTIATASHNTVVIDGQSQVPGSTRSPTDGRLEMVDLNSTGRVQVIRVDGRRAYPNLARKYRRTLIVVDAGEQQQYAVDLFEIEGGSTHDYFLHGTADEPAAVSADCEFRPRATLLPPDFEWAPPDNEGQSHRAYAPHDPYGFLSKLRQADLPGQESVRVDFRTRATPTAGLRATLCPQASCRLVLGENPSIRQAQEDDAVLNDFQRPFMMLRRQGSNLSSTFVTVLEPFAAAPFIKSVVRQRSEHGSTVLQMQLAGRTDWIVVNAEAGQAAQIQVTSGERASFRGDVGFVSLAGDDLDFAYAVGEGGWQIGEFALSSPDRQRWPVTKIDRTSIIAAAASESSPQPGDVIRVCTSDGWVYPFHVESARARGANELEIEVAEPPRMEFDASHRTLQTNTFPQRRHTGDVYVEWQPSAVWMSNVTSP